MTQIVKMAVWYAYERVSIPDFNEVRGIGVGASYLPKVFLSEVSILRPSDRNIF